MPEQARWTRPRVNGRRYAMEASGWQSCCLHRDRDHLGLAEPTKSTHTRGRSAQGEARRDAMKITQNNVDSPGHFDRESMFHGAYCAHTLAQSSIGRAQHDVRQKSFPSNRPPSQLLAAALAGTRCLCLMMF